jgi:protein-L-isoaspartate O-methyltransferase
MTATTAADAEEARRLRDAMTDKLVRLGSVTSPQIEAAFRTVPRHAFVRPGTPLEECYRGTSCGTTSVLTGDGEHGAPGHGPFDAIIATAGAWDIPPAWTAQLKDTGTIVAPLRMNGVTRSFAFRKHASHLVSTSAVTCGFVHFPKRHGSATITWPPERPSDRGGS